MTTITTPYHRHHQQRLLSSLVILLFLSVIFTSSEAQTGPNVPVTDPYQQYSRFTPSLAIIIIILVAALFLMGFFSIYIRRCSDTTNSRSGIIVVAGRSRRGPRGLDKEVIESFPTFPYSDVKHLKIGKGALECAVCLNEFEEDETLRLLPKCDHVFHPECIDAWLSSHTTCPVCRANLAEGTVSATEVNSNLAAEVESDSDESSPHRGRDAELGGADAVSIRVTTGENENDDAGTQDQQLNPTQLRSRSITSIIFSKFSRSHSTGHSLVQPGENVERFTLKLPDDIRKQIMSRRLKRSTSLVVLPREASSRRGYRTGEPIDGSSKGKHIKRLGSLELVNNSDRWVFSKTLPFFARESSFNNKSPRMNPGNEEWSSKRFGMLGRMSFNRLGSKRDNPGSMTDDSNRPPV